MTVQITKNARPIISGAIKEHYDRHQFRQLTLDQYADAWREWMTASQHKSLSGLELLPHADYVQGTTQTFDHFVLRHAKNRTIVCVQGDFQYHACIAKHSAFAKIQHSDDIRSDHALIISLPFSGLGSEHPGFQDLLFTCDRLEVPVCVDLAYWGIAKNIGLDLSQHTSICEITCSLSKPFYTLEHHRVGIRFSRNYPDDGVSMTNEVGTQNFHSMSLGLHFMREFSADWNWQHHQSRYFAVCRSLELNTTDTVIFGISHDPKYQDFNRGIPNQHRVGVSLLLKDIE